MEFFAQIVINSFVAGATYTLITLGFNLIYGATKFINMAHGAIAVAGGYTVFFFTKLIGFSLGVSIILGIVIAGFLGYLADKIVFRPLRRKQASNLVLFLASLGLFTLLQAILAILFTSQFQTLILYVPTYEIVGAAITRVQLIIILVGIISFGGLLTILQYTKFGKAVRAISDDEEVAKIVGINTDKIIGLVFFIGSALAGLAGILIGFDTGLRPTMGLLILLEGAVASIIGGIGNVYGGVLGSFLLAFAENFGVWKIPSEWKAAITFSILLILLLFRPQGIFKK
jgi:branched-subunit amino acid ABC-type transport system permease component